MPLMITAMKREKDMVIKNGLMITYHEALMMVS